MDDAVLWMNSTGHALDVITDANLGGFRAVFLQIKPLFLVNLVLNYCPGLGSIFQFVVKMESNTITKRHEATPTEWTIYSEKSQTKE